MMKQKKTSKDSGSGSWNYARGSDDHDGFLLHRLRRQDCVQRHPAAIPAELQERHRGFRQAAG